jgi:hypothetical protein
MVSETPSCQPCVAPGAELSGSGGKPDSGQGWGCLGGGSFRAPLPCASKYADEPTFLIPTCDLLLPHSKRLEGLKMSDIAAIALQV